MKRVLRTHCRLCRLVGLSGLEPPTSRLSGARSNLLSYKPISDRVSRDSFPPTSLCPTFASVTLAGCLPLPLNIADDWVPALPAGGDDGIRTHDPLLAGQVLSQLSYTPVFSLSHPRETPSKLNNDPTYFNSYRNRRDPVPQFSLERR